MASYNIFDDFLNYGNKLLEKPYILIDQRKGPLFQEETKKSLKKIHDLLGEFHSSLLERHTFNKIIIDRMDHDQIWAQINRTSQIIDRDFKKGLRLLKAKEKPVEVEDKAPLDEGSLSEKSSRDSVSPVQALAVDEEISNDNSRADAAVSEGSAIGESEAKSNRKEGGGIDYEDLENFLEDAENKDFREIQEELYGSEGSAPNDEDGKDDEENNGLGEDEDNIKYADFYGGDGQIEEEGNPDDSLENEVFEDIREAELGASKSRLDEEIDRLEDRILNPKPWQLKGEVRSSQRPKNSLLNERLDFKSGAQILENTISREFSENLEKTIRQRILDEAWDDVPMYDISKPVQENFADNKETLDFGRSQKGLAEIYEDKFKKNLLNLPVETEGDKAKVEIQDLFRSICYHLDNLSNLSFVPKPDALLPAKIAMNNVPSIKREEKIPIFMSEGNQKAASEMFDNRKKAVFEEKVEMASGDKKRLHRKVKRNIRNRLKEKRKKERVETLAVNGQTKFEYNQAKKSQAKIKKETQQKKTQSVKYTKSSQFFQNLQAANEKKGKETEKNNKEMNGRKNFKL